MFEKINFFIKKFIEDESACCPRCQKSSFCDAFTQTEAKGPYRCCRECNSYQNNTCEGIEYIEFCGNPQEKENIEKYEILQKETKK